jgi:outer membrane receptor protein involved in Fe transport
MPFDYGMKQTARQVWLALALCAAHALAGGVNARQTAQGGIRGVVTDAAGAAVVGARVSLLTPPQILRRTAESDAEGRFTFAGAPPGSYILQISKEGYGTRREAVQVPAGGMVSVSVSLDVSSLKEEVTVTAETGLAADRERVPQQVNVIPQEAIQQRATSVLAQVADEEVGVSFQRTSPTVGSVLVRGLTEVGVYVDGVRFTQSTQRGGINTFFNLN